MSGVVAGTQGAHGDLAEVRVNLVVASVYLLASVGNVVGESWTYYFVLAVGLEVVRPARRAPEAWLPSPRGR